MAKAARRLGAAIMAGLWVTTTPGLAAEAVVVVGIDDAGCGGFPSELEAAKTEASRTYSMIGVSLVWTVKGTKASASPTGAFDVTVALLSRARAETFLMRRRLSSTVLGVAPPGTRRIYVFCGRIRQRALEMNEKAETILGRVIAHELGHLLLPANGHSATGIMRASLDYTTEEALRFTEAEANAIHAFLTSSR